MRNFSAMKIAKTGAPKQAATKSRSDRPSQIMTGTAIMASSGSKPAAEPRFPARAP